MPAPFIKRGKNGTDSLEKLIGLMYTDLDTLNSYTVATLPSPATAPRGLAYCSNGAAGQPAVVFNNGTAWKVVATMGATASAT